MESMTQMKNDFRIRRQAQAGIVFDPISPKVMSATDQILFMIEEFKKKAKIYKYCCAYNTLMYKMMNYIETKSSQTM